MLKKFKYFLSKKIKNVAQKNILFQSNIPEITPIFIKKTKIPFEKRVNLLVPSLNREHFFGGIATALKFFNSILEKLREDKLIAFRIILTDIVKLDRDIPQRFPDFKITDREDTARFQIFPFGDRINKKLPVIKHDYFIATAWWTAYLSKQIIKQQKKLFNRTNKFVYLIQDYEPGFYSWSSKYILAESTYKDFEKIIAVFNSSLLMDFFQRMGWNFTKKYYFEPQLNENLIKFLPLKEKISKERIILIYGRPFVPRNAFELIKIALEAWVQKDSRASSWRLISVGEKHPDLTIASQKMISLGKLPLEDYAHLLLRSAIGISFMISPHPSYPPLEMANFGLLTLTNQFANKDLSKWHSNIYSLNSLDPEYIAQKLEKLVTLFEKDPSIGLKGKDLTGFYLSNTPDFPFIENVIADLLRERL